MRQGFWPLWGQGGPAASLTGRRPGPASPPTDCGSCWHGSELQCDPRYYRPVNSALPICKRWQQGGNTREKPAPYADDQQVTPAKGPNMSSTPVHIVIAGAGPAAQALVRRLAGRGSGSRQRPFDGTITVLSNRDECPEALLELAELPQVSVRFGQAASFIDAEAKIVTTVDGMEFSYDQLVIATGSAP